MSDARNALDVLKVSKAFHDPVTVKVLKEVSLELKRGEFVSITGKSGCGKSTLLYMGDTKLRQIEFALMID